MARPFVSSAVLLVASFGLFAPGHATPALAEEPVKKVPSIKDIMRDAHHCRTAYIKIAGDELKKENPDWAVVESKSRELVQAGKQLALNTPRKGTKESWENFTTLYTARATVLASAAERKDVEEAKLMSQRLSGMCVTCHRAHR